MHIFEQLRLEELLLRHDNSCWCLINSGPKVPAIVTGFSGKVPELVEIDAARRDGIGVIRRFTGGGTVVVDENTFFVSFICNVSDWVNTIYHLPDYVSFIVISDISTYYTGTCAEFGYWGKTLSSRYYELDGTNIWECFQETAILFERK